MGEEGIYYEEIIYSKKDQLFYALTDMGHLEAWDLRDPTSPKPTLIPIGDQINQRTPDLSKSKKDLRGQHHSQSYLVELSGGDILYVDRYFTFIQEDGTYADIDGPGYFHIDFQLPYRTTRFDIFKLELGKGNIEYVTSIGDNALFLGHNHSFSLSTCDNPHLKPNAIYFADVGDYFIYEKKGYRYRGQDTGVYSLEDHSVTPLYHPFEFKKILPPPIWVFPGKD